MPGPLIVASAAAAGLSAIGKAGVGIGQLIGANKKDDKLVRPLYDIQDEYFNNRDISARMASTGLTEGAKDYYTDSAGRGLSTTASAILQTGGGANAVNRVFDNYKQGIRSIAAEDSERQQKNIMAFMEQNANVAKQKTMKWVIDKYEPYKDKAKAIAQQRAAGLQNIFSGGAELTGALGALGAADVNADLNKVPGAGTPQTAETVPGSVTMYNTSKPSSAYDDFVSPFDVPPVQQRVAQVQQQVADTDLTGLDADLQEYYRNLYKL